MEHLTVTTQDGIAIVQLNRPPVNALSYQTFPEIVDAFDAISASREASVAILMAAPRIAGVLRRRRSSGFASSSPCGRSPRGRRTQGRCPRSGGCRPHCAALLRFYL